MEIPAWAWLEDLALREGRYISLSQVPDAEWDRLRDLGFDLVWLMGVWRRSPFARHIFRDDPKRFPEYDRALPAWKLKDVVGSPYAVHDYRPDRRIGTWRDIDRARRKLRDRGIGLILDLVPNHTAPDHPWVRLHPEYYVEGSEQQFRNDPSRFTLLEDKNGTPQFLARGRDPFFPAWPDTAQLNLFHAGLRQEFAALIGHVAQYADGLRCDMSMLALNDIFARTWEGFVPAALPIEFWQQAIEAAPDLVWLGEAYWGTETRLHQLGFRFTYDKPFYDFLRAGSAGDLRRHLGIVSQDLQNDYEPDAHGLEIVLSGLYGSIGIHAHQSYSEADVAHARALMDDIGIAGLAHTPYAQMSTGQQRRCLLGRALIHDPDTLILDEPTNGLDPAARTRMIRLIYDMKESGKMHLLLCSHLLRDVEETCEDALILKRGRIVHHSNLESERRTNKRFVEIQTHGDDTGFGEALAAVGCQCSAAGNGRFKAVLPEEFELREIYRVAAGRDLQLRRLNYRRDTLEDIFMKAMED